MFMIKIILLQLSILVRVDIESRLLLKNMKKENIKYYVVASRGRDPDNPSDRSSGNPNLVQRLEINKSGFTNCITSVTKDCLILEIYEK